MCVGGGGEEEGCVGVCVRKGREGGSVGEGVRMCASGKECVRMCVCGRESTGERDECG